MSLSKMNMLGIGSAATLLYHEKKMWTTSKPMIHKLRTPGWLYCPHHEHVELMGIKKKEELIDGIEYRAGVGTYIATVNENAGDHLYFY